MSNLLEELKKVREAFRWTWGNIDKEHTADSFNIPANGLTVLDDIIEWVDLDLHWIENPSMQIIEDDAVGFAEWLTTIPWAKGEYGWYEKNEKYPIYCTTAHLFKIYKNK